MAMVSEKSVSNNFYTLLLFFFSFLILFEKMSEDW